MVFENEREGEIKETFSSMPKNERAAQKFSSLLLSRNVNKRKKERDELPPSNAISDSYRHENLYARRMGCKGILLPHAGKFDQEVHATLST